MPRITPFLWFDHQAEEAAKHYVSIFPGSRIVKTARYEQRAFAAMMRMKKLDIEALKRAYDG